MQPTSKTFTASAASLFAFAFFAMAAPAVHADEYCITNGAQTAHGCGYPNMEACRAASAGIGGTCTLASSSKSASDSMASQSKQSHRSRKEPAGN